MKKRIIAAFIAAIAVSAGLHAQGISKEEFQKPSAEYGPMTWWHWINGNVTREGILKDLSAMHEVGIRGVQMFNTHMYMPKGPVQFGSEEWYGLVKYAIEVCDSLGMKFTCMTGAGWSGSGGPQITLERSMKKLVWSETQVNGGQVRTMLKQPEAVKDFYRDELVLAVPSSCKGGQIPDLDSKIMMANKAMLVTPAELASVQALRKEDILDLSRYCNSDGILECSLPQGDWTVIRFGYTTTGKQSHPAAWGGEGYEVNKFCAEDVEFQFDQIMGKLCEIAGPYLGTTFEGILFDSYEASWQNWTAGMFDKFIELNGYDLRPYMPLFTGRPVASAMESERVLYDFRKLCDHLLTECFYGTMQKKANGFGMKIYAEAQGGPVPAGAMDKVDIPMNEFWTPDTRPRLTKLKLTSTQADFQGKNIVAAEAFTSKPENGKWQNTPRIMKRPGDLAFAGGINRYCFHTYAMQPLDYIAPGFGLGRYGLIFSRLSTWWDYSPAWMEYITRSQYILQHGRNVADICFVFHDDIRYNFPSGMVRMPSGYDYLISYPAQLEGAEYKDGRIIFTSGLKTRMLVIPDNARMDFNTLSTIHRLVKEGAPLLAIGQTPLTAASLKQSSELDQSAYDRLAKDLFEGLDGKAIKQKKCGKGTVYKGIKLDAAIKLAQISPDIDFGDNCYDRVFYLHRTLGDAEYYYLTNQTLETIDMEPVFNVHGLKPEIWDPVSGKTCGAKLISNSHEGVGIDLTLKPEESVFVVFQKDAEGYKEPYIPYMSSEVSGTWEVSFTDKRQFDKGPVGFDRLCSWTENTDEKIRYYSGTAVYSNSIKISSKDLHGSKKVEIDLGEVKDIARVFVNGKDAGILWTPPFRTDISKLVKSGMNNIEIHVANTWINRIIGDEQYPSDIKYELNGSKFTIGRLSEYPEWLYDGEQPNDRKRVTFYTWKHYDADSPLKEAGLMGPVKVEFLK